MSKTQDTNFQMSNMTREEMMQALIANENVVKALQAEVSEQGFMTREWEVASTEITVTNPKTGKPVQVSFPLEFSIQEFAALDARFALVNRNPIVIEKHPKGYKPFLSLLFPFEGGSLEWPLSFDRETRAKYEEDDELDIKTVHIFKEISGSKWHWCAKGEIAE